MRQSKSFIISLLIFVAIGFFAGVVGELWVNSFLLPDPYLDFKNFDDLTKRLDELVENKQQEKKIIEFDRQLNESVAKVKPALVNVYKYEVSGKSVKPADYLSKGMIVTGDGLIMLLDEFLPSGQEKFYIKTSDNELHVAEKRKTDLRTGVVFLKIEAQNLSVAEFALKNDLIQGQSVFSLDGSDSLFGARLANLALSEFSSFSDALRSDKPVNYLHSSEEFYKKYKLDSEINADYVGAPVIGFDGRVIGIILNVRGEVLPLNQIMPVMRHVGIEEEKVWPYLGIKFYDLNEIAYPELTVNSGAYIPSASAIAYDSPAKEILKSGDIIIKIEQEELSSVRNLSTLLSEYQPHDKIKFFVIRNGEEKSFDIELGEY